MKEKGGEGRIGQRSLDHGTDLEVSANWTVSPRAKTAHRRLSHHFVAGAVREDQDTVYMLSATHAPHSGRASSFLREGNPSDLPPWLPQRRN